MRRSLSLAVLVVIFGVGHANAQVVDQGNGNYAVGSGTVNVPSRTVQSLSASTFFFSFFVPSLAPTLKSYDQNWSGTAFSNYYNGQTWTGTTSYDATSRTLRFSGSNLNSTTSSYQYISHYQEYGHYEYYSYRCGFLGLSTCTGRNYVVDGSYPVYSTASYTSYTNESFSLSSAFTPQALAAPGPIAGAGFPVAIGLLGLAYLRWRRKGSVA